MKKVRNIRKILSIVLIIAVFATSLNTNNIIADSAVMYNNQGYDTVEEAIEAVVNSEDTNPVVIINNPEITITPFSVEKNKKITLRAIKECVVDTGEGECKSAVITVNEGATVILENIILDGKKDEGDRSYKTNIVNNKGTLIMMNSSIQNFSSSAPTIYMKKASFQMDDNSKVYNNINTVWGGTAGAFSTSQECHISGGQIENNHVSHWAAGIRAGGDLYIDGTTIKGNSSMLWGGILTSSNLYMKDCTVESNTSSYGGAAVCQDGDGRVEIYNSTICNNAATGTGGGIGLGGSGEKILAGVEIYGNTRANGAGIGLSGGTCVIKEQGSYDTPFGTVETKENIIKENSSNGNGGGIYVGSGASMTVEQCSLTENTAVKGGAIYNDGNLNLDNVVVQENVATEKNATYEDMEAGTGIYQNGTLNLYDNVQLCDQLYLPVDKYAIFMESPLYHISGGSALKISIDENAVSEFRKIAEFSGESAEENAFNLANSGAVNASEDGNIPKGAKVISNGNNLGICSSIYGKEIICQDENGNPVENVEFNLYRKEETNILYGATDLSNSEGKIKIQNIMSGTYILKQKSMPDSFEKNAEIQYEFTVGEGENTEQLTIILNHKDEAPVAVITMDKKKYAIDEKCVFQGGDSYDDYGIVSYAWDFGDGTKGEGVEAEHSYSIPGKYLVILTVKDAKGNTNSKKTVVTIDGNIDGKYRLSVLVKSTDDGSAIRKAAVSIKDSENKEIENSYTDDSGEVFCYLDANQQYVVTAYAKDYYVRTTNVSIEEESKQITMYLSSDKTVVGTLTSSEMTLSEMKAAGIDTTSDANKQVFKFETIIAFRKVNYTVSYCINLNQEIVASDWKPTDIIQKPGERINIVIEGGGGMYIHIIYRGFHKMDERYL